MDETTDPRKQLARWIKESGLKKSAVASRIGVSASAMGSWMRGEFSPSGPARVTIQALTGIPVEAWRGDAS